MKKQFFIFFCLIISRAFSQEFNSKWSHAISGGASYCVDQDMRIGVDYISIKYKTPGYAVFYRLIESSKMGFSCFTLNANYRTGSGTYTTSGSGGSYSIQGPLDWCRLDLGFTQLFPVGKNKDFSFGPGVYGGGIIYAKGTIKVEETSLGALPQTYDINANDVMNKTHLGFHIEIQQKIDLSEVDGLIIGLRLGLESPDGFRILKFTKLASGYIGYQFARKKKVKPAEQTNTEK